MGKFEQAIHQLPEPMRIGQKIRDKALPALFGHRVGMVLQQFQRALNRSQVCFELVRDIGREAADIVGPFRKCAGHARKTLGEPGDFDRGRILQGIDDFLFSAFDFFGLQNQLPNRPRDRRGSQRYVMTTIASRPVPACRLPSRIFSRV